MQRDVANTRRGKLIVFEGLDKAGKSTQCSLLIRKFEQQGIKVRKQTFPGALIYSLYSLFWLWSGDADLSRQIDSYWPVNKRLSERPRFPGRSCHSPLVFGESLGSCVGHLQL